MLKSISCFLVAIVNLRTTVHIRRKFVLLHIFFLILTILGNWVLPFNKFTVQLTKSVLSTKSCGIQFWLLNDFFLFQQRVLKYPLLLREILILSESLEIVSSKVRRRLKAALISMNGVARHINDFQTVHDEFGNDGLNEIMKQAMAKIKEEFNVSIWECLFTWNTWLTKTRITWNP